MSASRDRGSEVRVSVRLGYNITYVSIYEELLGDPEVTANIYCKSRNFPNIYTQKYSTDLR